MNTQTPQDEPAVETALSVTESFTTSQTRGEIDVQISTAHRYPRDITRFLKQAETLSTLNDEIAGSCFYKLKRQSRDGGDKAIEGPSVRFAEIVAATWGHLRVDARTINEDDRFVYAQGVAWDLQSNVAIRFETRRRITDRNGRRYSDDMIAVTANAAAAIALRNAIFRVVPKAFWETVYQQAKAVAVGTAKTLGERRQKLLDYFTQKLGVAIEKVFAYLEVTGLDDITLAHLEDLRGLATAIKDGDTTIDAAFGPEVKPAAAKKASANGKASDPKAPLFLDDVGRKELWRIAKAAGWSTEELQAILRTRYQIDNPQQIPIEQVPAIRADIEQGAGS